MTIKAKAFLTGYDSSPTSAAVYQIQVTTPYFDPPGGLYDAPVDVSIYCNTWGATIRYTTDGTEPTSSSTIYTSPITISAYTVLKAKAFLAGLADSNTATAIYKFVDLKVATPILTGLGNGQVRIDCATSNVDIYYTTDETDPTQSSTWIANGGIVTYSGVVVIKAKAWRTGWTPSNVAWGLFNNGTVVQDQYDWGMFMHDTGHTGLNPYPDDLPAVLGTPIWTAGTQTASTTRTASWSYHNQPGGSVGGYIFEHPYIDSSPVVVGNQVVVGTWTRGTTYFNGTGNVKAFNATTGTLLWTSSTNPSMGGVASTPCVWNGKVYVGASNGYIYCLNLSNGTQVWAQQTTNRNSPATASKIIASPVVYRGVVYVGNEAGKMYALNAVTGAAMTGYPVVLPIEIHGVYGLNTQNMTGVSSAAVSRTNGSDYLIFGCDDGYSLQDYVGRHEPDVDAAANQHRILCGVFTHDNRRHICPGRLFLVSRLGNEPTDHRAVRLCGSDVHGRGVPIYPGV